MNELKSLIEQREEIANEMEAILSKAKTEERAVTEEETAKFESLEKKIKAIDKTIELEERARKTGDFKVAEKETKGPTKEELEERAFENYIKSQCGILVENRAGEQNFTVGNNGAVIPTSIANKIITKVQEMCPILAGVTFFSVNGTLKVPVYGKANTTHDITVSYSDDFSELTADSGAFTSIDLTGYLAGALTLIGKSLITNSQIDIQNFVINEIAKKVALFLEKELLNGTENKATGALSTATSIKAGSTSAITADNLIDLQAKIPTVYQANACWTMSPATFTAIKKLKAEQGRYLLQDNVQNGFPFMLLGKPVYISENMPDIASGAKAILYGDYSGLAVNMRQNFEIQVLNEKYATQHAIGIVAWFEFDSKIIDNQKLATLVMSAS